MNTSWVQTHPSFMEPGLVMQYAQASGAWYALAGGKPLIRLGAEDKQIYIKTLSVRGRALVSASAANQLPGSEIISDYILTPTYLLRSRAEYDHHDTAMASQWGYPIVEAQRLANRQAHFQLLRNMLLTGIVPSNGEGILNAANATKTPLPADSFGHQTARTYDNGQFATFLLSQFLAVKTATYQLGMPQEFVILGPQRILGLLEYPNIVQLTSYQRPGGGTTTTAGVVKEVLTLNGDRILWCYDDTLIGAGTNGTDAVIIIMPELEKPEVETWNTNEFAKLTPDLSACSLLYADVAAPIEIPTPLPGGAVDVLFEMRASPGWVIRPEALNILSIPY